MKLKIVIALELILINIVMAKIPSTCESQSFKTDEDVNLRYKFRDSYSWTSTAVNVIRFNWFNKFRADQTSKKICACALFKLYSDDNSDNKGVPFYNKVAGFVSVDDITVNVGYLNYQENHSSTESAKFQGVECRSESFACIILKGYRKKSFFSSVFDIYVVKDNKPNGVIFKAVMKDMDLSIIASEPKIIPIARPEDYDRLT